jgi:NAD(P)H-dependent FMN reductase
MYVPVILGTGRRGRESVKVAKYILKESLSRGLESEIIDVSDFKLYVTDDSLSQDMSREYARKMELMDGLIIVSPEYNHGYPGELKLLLDQIYREYRRKPVGIIGVSNGIYGGVRVVEQLRLVCLDLGLVPIRLALYFGPVQDIVDEDGNLLDEGFRSRVDRFFNELIWFIETLGYGRENIPYER